MKDLRKMLKELYRERSVALHRPEDDDSIKLDGELLGKPATGALYSLAPNHTNYATGVTNQEIARFSLAEGERLEVTRLEVNFRGGGFSSNFTASIYDETADSILAHTQNRVIGDPIGVSEPGASVIARVTNNTGSDQDVAIPGILEVVDE